MAQKLLILAVAVFLISCTRTNVYLLDPTVHYTSTDHVKLLTETPQRPYKKLASLETSGPYDTELEKLQRRMLRKAAKIGADAVIQTGVASTFMAPDPYTTGVAVLQFNGGSVKVIHGVAIKYTDNSSEKSAKR